ncbi:hypothetical protein WVI01_03290 [Weissella viridescens]|uniref:Uncharacterized protein n=1 Tax=Weissella viridescens TaxID=1629 RepID=A0A0R2H0V5_WEIVI|nr:hypothetical protein [Weissella viridescens]KRN46562.1 hypothetical protein IV50_GL000840 [Weissella viridescens]GEA94406.1 hypothetical protein WVI01_03290 [Weissella viridescens]SUP52807.1 Uncharacterised protein [Weissella viridescens]
MDVGILLILFIVGVICLMYGVQGHSSMRNRTILTVAGLACLIAATFYFVLNV